ncbi:MAG TPA: carbon-nitrogen hydrolase family protein [Mycobacteriales bacterium]|jgi:predicted amidohydrolase|nr:carbon-nitrogen hydrolase family protein [Mycobacteriales bacterium]
MRVALCQITSVSDPAVNLERVRAGISWAASQGAAVALFPEATMACFGTALAPLAEPIDGPWATAVREIADAHRMLVVTGMFTPAPRGRVYNTLLVTGRDHHLGYRKVHLFDAFGFRESETVAPGDDVLTVSLDGTVFGLATCYDVRFPELFRALADRGATAVLLGASWGAGDGKREQWELLVRARALDSTCWVLACDQADPLASEIAAAPHAPTGIGYSTVADPTGRVRAQLGDGPDGLVVEIDSGLVESTRRAIPVLANRRL